MVTQQHENKQTILKYDVYIYDEIDTTTHKRKYTNTHDDIGLNVFVPWIVIACQVLSIVTKGFGYHPEHNPQSILFLFPRKQHHECW